MKKKSMLQKVSPIVLSTCMFTLLAACGSDDDDNGTSVVQQEEQQQEGRYRVVLTPLNPLVASNATGTGEFTIEADEFKAIMNISGATSTTHVQRIHLLGSCPDQGSDTNEDGFIDVVEAISSVGSALVPIDNDLRSQLAGGTFPIGATYNYKESTSLLAMLADLRLPDPDNSDELVKLGADEDLNLEGRVVLIHGVPSSTSLPATVRGLGETLTAQQALPILCGVITRAEDETGTTEN